MMTAGLSDTNIALLKKISDSDSVKSKFQKLQSIQSTLNEKHRTHSPTVSSWMPSYPIHAVEGYSNCKVSDGWNLNRFLLGSTGLRSGEDHGMEYQTNKVPGRSQGQL